MHRARLTQCKYTPGKHTAVGSEDAQDQINIEML